MHGKEKNKSPTRAIIGLDLNFKYFYVLQKKTMLAPISGTLDDGRTQDEESGIWKVDISSLGLSE